MSKPVPKGKPVALTQSKSARKNADAAFKNKTDNNSLPEQQNEGQQDKKRVLVVDKNDRDAQARELAEAWGLTRATESDDEEESIKGGSDNDQVDRKAGLGAATTRTKVDVKSLEYKLERARQKQKKDAMNRSVELNIWNTAENEDAEEEDEDTKSKLAKTKKKPRIARVYDNVPDVVQQSSSANSAKKNNNKAATEEQSS